MRRPDTTDFRRRFRLAAGIALVAAGVFGAIHSVRAAVERHPRFVVADERRESIDYARGDVRRV